MEKAVVFVSGGEKIRGILHPGDVRDGVAPARARTGVIFCHGWSGCRLGPHDMFVKLARRLAERGMSSLRFDFRGRGESEGNAPEAGIGAMTVDTLAAAAFMRESTGVAALAIVGICSGGKVAIGAAVQDASIRHLALWSCEPMGDLRTAAVETRKRVAVLRDYGRKLLRIETWKKILAGRVNTGQVRRAVVRSEETPNDGEIRAERVILDRFAGFPGDVMLIHGTNDPDTALAAGRYAALFRKSSIPVESHAVQGANHSFYSLAWEREVMDRTAEWLERVSQG